MSLHRNYEVAEAFLNYFVCRIRVALQLNSDQGNVSKAVLGSLTINRYMQNKVNYYDDDNELKLNDSNPQRSFASKR